MTGVILSIEGDEATGKTTMAYTAPTPIVGFSFDLGSERALYGAMFDKNFKDKKIQIVEYRGPDWKPEELWDGHDITVYEFPRPIQLDETRLLGFSELWDQFQHLFISALRDAKVRTIVVDTMTLARRVKADAHLQDLQENAKGRPRKQLIQIEWGPVNDNIRDIYALTKNSRKNMVALHHLTDERKDGLDKDGNVVSMLTGNRVLEGLNQTYRSVDIAVRNTKNKGQLTTTFIKNGYAMSLEGLPVGQSWGAIVDITETSLSGRLKFDR